MRNIIFYPKNELVKEIIPPPQKVSVPEWFKKMPLYQNNDNRLRIINNEPNYTAKTCMPFLDTFMTGYTFNLHCDILVEINAEGNQTINWSNNLPAPVVARGYNDNLVPQQQGTTNLTFNWVTHWGIKLPRGYSALLTHPLNRTELPFVTTSGILDADKWGIWGNQPFSLIQGFQGVIYKDTPIIQIIPFKRHSWTSSTSKKLGKWAHYENLRRARVFTGYYKKHHWTKKDFS